MTASGKGRAGDRIHIFGASGSGTTTLGKALAERLEVPVLDVDSYFWKQTDPPYTTTNPPADRLAAIKHDLRGRRSWVISGSMCGWGDPLTPRLTLAVFLYVDPSLRLDRLRRRERAEFGARIDPDGDMFEIHRDFMDWASDYDAGGMDMRSLAVHEAWMQRLVCRVVRLDGTQPVGSLVENVLNTGG